MSINSSLGSGKTLGWYATGPGFDAHLLSSSNFFFCLKVVDSLDSLSPHS